MASEEPRALTRTHFVTVPLTGFEPQPLELGHCTQFIQIDRFLGEFQLLDDSGLVIGTSKQGRLSLLKRDLTTDAAKVWYAAMTKTSPEYKLLTEKYKVEDPGLDLEVVQPLKIQFLHAPKTQERFIHVPVYCRITCVWNPQTFGYVSA